MLKRPRGHWLLIATGLGLALAAACSSDDAITDAGATAGTAQGGGSATGGGQGGTNSGGSGGSGTNSGGSGGSTTTYTTGSGPPPTSIAMCGNKLYDCGDLIDNDNDGLIDSQDPDCLGPCDNTEDSYYTDLPGMSGGPCKSDCFWDNGNGSGTDDCFWDHKCDPLSVAPDYPPEGEGCAYDPDVSVGGMTCEEAFNNQSDTCLAVCEPLTPTGCDCFGCCELPAGGGEYVWLGSVDDDKNPTCDQAAVGDNGIRIGFP